VLVIVGGHTRNIGKTSVAAGLIAALPGFNWTAIKITQHGHGFCDDHGRTCDCAAPAGSRFAIDEEAPGGSPHTDSGRFLAAGARRAFWVRTAAGELGHAMPALREIVGSSENVIAESNSLMQFVQPDLYLAVLDFAAADFKESARRYLDRASAVVVLHGGGKAPAWKGVSPALWQSAPRFPAWPPVYVTRELADFVAQALHRP
jgi:hypothetical protein